MSERTSGSAFSWMVTPAVVWGLNTQTRPSFTPASATTRRTRSVTSIISSRRVVRTERVVIPPNVAVAPTRARSDVLCMRRLAALLLCLGCDGVDPELAADAGCARPPTDWEVLVGGEASSPMFHGETMYFSRGLKILDDDGPWVHTFH